MRMIFHDDVGYVLVLVVILIRDTQGGILCEQSGFPWHIEILLILGNCKVLVVVRCLNLWIRWPFSLSSSKPKSL
jgi:hypothetical protein